MIDRARFSMVLKEYRARAGMSQAQLSAAAGMSHSYVSRLESGERTARRETVRRLAAAMNLTADETDRMLIRVGLMPSDPRAVLADEPVLVRAADVLGDADDLVAVELRAAIGEAIDQAEAEMGRTAAGVSG